MLKTRKLGQQGLVVSTVGLGCMGMSSTYGPADEVESVNTIHRALDLGVTMFDTAEQYGPYVNEELLGRALRGKRHQAIIATKVGMDIRDGKSLGVNSRPAHIKQAVEGSLRRLGVDYIDLLYQHRVDPQVPIEEVVGAMSDLVGQGKVRFLGLSEAGETNLRRAHATFPISALQSEYSLWERNLEERLVGVIRQLGIGLVPFSPLGRGFLTGVAQRAEAYPEDDFRREDPRLQGANFDANVNAAAIVKQIASERGYKPGQIALAWVLHKGDDIIPIPGTKRRSYLEENVQAASIELAPSELDALDSALPPGVVSGARYSVARMSTVDR